MTALGSTHPRIHWVPGGGALFAVAKMLGRVVDHLPLSSAKFKNAWNHISTPPVWRHVVHSYNLLLM